MYDVVIKNGTVVDGTRLPRVVTDVGITGGRIAKIGRIDDTEGARVLDATGLIVAPGFVDLHCHYDAQIHWDPYCTVSGWHGVTSLVLGNCGFGFAPVKPADRDRALLMMTRTEQIPYESMKEGMAWNWETFPEWLDNLDRIPKGVNIVSFVPMNALMVYVMGLDDAKSGRPATPEEQREMQRLLREAIVAGASGFSIQRLGERSLQADFDGTPMPTDLMCDADVLALADVLRELDEGFIQITQSTVGNGDLVTETANTAITDNHDFKFIETLADRAQRPVLWNAVAAIDEVPDFHRHVMEWLDDCQRRGLRIVGQGANVRTWFQFTLEHWNLYDSSPAWNRAMQGTVEERVERLADPELVAAMVAEDGDLITQGIGGPIQNLTVASHGGNKELEKYVGRTLGDIAETEGRHHVEAMIDIAVQSGLQAEFRTASATSTNPALVGELMSHPYVIPGISDGGAHIKFFTGGSYPTDMLAWLVRDEGQLTLEEAHWHLSYLPAQAAGFHDRGFLRAGAPADVVVYDLENLKRTPEFEFDIAHDFPAGEWRRIQRAEGYRWILVNGEVTFEDGECTSATPGVLLRAGQGADLALVAGA
jgi:N-acyl-D-aspartate/D-glutamate deacylase